VDNRYKECPPPAESITLAGVSTGTLPLRTTASVSRSQHGDVPIAVVSDPETFLAKIREYEQTPELFIDVETADWWTSAPRVALLQVWAGREVSVFDVLAPGIGAVLSGDFVPRIMSNERVRKWAHNAAYEKRFLGGACV